MSPEDIISYWIGDQSPQSFGDVVAVFKRHNRDLDEEMRERFTDALERARAGEFDDWATTPRGLFALLVLLDQFPRHIYRGQARQYASDPKALALSQSAIERGWHREFGFVEQIYIGMPLAHSEELEVQHQNVAYGDEISAAAPQWLDFFAEIPPSQSRKYRNVIERFGRFPHRNDMLGRSTTPEEAEFLETWAERQPPDPLRERGLVGPPIHEVGK